MEGLYEVLTLSSQEFIERPKPASGIILTALHN